MPIMFLGAIDQTVVRPAWPIIGRALGQFSAVSWIFTLYLLSATAVTPLVGKLTDLHGRRGIIAGSVLTCMVGSVGSALAPNVLLLIVARGVRGLSGGAPPSRHCAAVGQLVLQLP